MLAPLNILTEIAAPIDAVNVDTDQLTPIHRIAKMQRDRPNYADSLFYNERYDADGRELPEFILNRPFFRQARILVTAENFGCGSSREHAVWALADFGVRAIVGPSFGDIFFQNCATNGLLVIRLDPSVCSDLRTQLHRSPGAKITIDLPEQILIAPDKRQLKFEIDAFRKQCLMRGVDDIGLTLDYAADIGTWERERNLSTPWMGGVADASRSSPPLQEDISA